MGKDNYCTFIFVRVIDIAVDPGFGLGAIKLIYVNNSKLMMGFTILVNIFTIWLIIKKVRSEQVFFEGRPINNISTMVSVICVESSALMIIITFIFFLSSSSVLIGRNSLESTLIPMQLLVHVYVSLHVSCRISIQANETHKNT